MSTTPASEVAGLQPVAERRCTTLSCLSTFSKAAVQAGHKSKGAAPKAGKRFYFVVEKLSAKDFISPAFRSEIAQNVMPPAVQYSIW